MAYLMGGRAQSLDRPGCAIAILMRWASAYLATRTRPCQIEVRRFFLAALALHRKR